MSAPAVTTPLDRQRTMSLILDLVINHPGLPMPQSIEFNEHGGNDGTISALGLTFDKDTEYSAWADYLQIPRDGWQRREDRPHPTLPVAMYNAVAFDWQGWRQVELHAAAETCEKCHGDAALRNCSAHLGTHGGRS